MDRIPASERTRERLKASMNGESEAAGGPSEDRGVGAGRQPMKSGRRRNSPSPSRCKSLAGRRKADHRHPWRVWRFRRARRQLS
jgi:hypothetical protein